MRRFVITVLLLNLTAMQPCMANDVLAAFRELGAARPAIGQPVEPSRPPAWEPSSLDAIDFGLKLLKLNKSDVLLDAGCGDGLVIAKAAVDYPCRSIGIEIEPEQAARAQKTVAYSNVEGRALVLLGDFEKFSFVGIGATKAYVYLYPNDLAKIADKLTKLKAFVSYMHDVPGVKTRKVGDFYVWEKESPVVEAPAVATRLVETQRYADWNGRRYYQEYNPGCSCAMCASIRYQLSQPRHVVQQVQQVQQAQVVPEPAKPAKVQPALPKVEIKVQAAQPRMVQRWACVNGRCGWYWFNE